MAHFSLLKRIFRISIPFLFAALPLTAGAQPDLTINELMPKNVSFLMDKSHVTKIWKQYQNKTLRSTTTQFSDWTNTFQYSMWVEIYNPTGASKTLSNYYFTDELSKPEKWKPSSINGSVPAFSYTVLFFEREDEEAFICYKPENTSFTKPDGDYYIWNRRGHASFKLDPDGGKLYILNSSLTVVDSVVYPAQYRNISYGRETDGSDYWVFFEQPSPGSRNDGKKWATQQCIKPTLSHKNGFYDAAINLAFAMPADGETIYYTTDGSEPTTTVTATCKRYTPSTTITLEAGVHKIRARSFSSGKLSSDIVTNTYFIGQRSFNDLPVISIVTEHKFLYDSKTGIYTDGDGTNGLPGRGQSGNKNYNQDWDRPANFEFFDKTGKPQLNQEVDISLLGGFSRSHPQKSISISPKNKFGSNMLNYDFFAATKPGHKYRDIQLRNSGNDYNQSHMRDAFFQSLVAHRMNIDYLAYEPAVVFINGSYMGIQNMRERTNADFVFSNYGYAKDDIELIEGMDGYYESKNDIPTDPSFARLVSFLKNTNLTKPENYAKACDSIDVDEFINYMVTQIYIANMDWPHNNVKMWRKKNGGKWRWILYDTDFGFNLYGDANVKHNTLMYAIGGAQYPTSDPTTGSPEWSYIIFKRLCTNPDFVSKLVDRFAVHLSTTFKPDRVNNVMDSLADRIRAEMLYHKQRWGGSVNDLSGWRTFAATRNQEVMTHVINYFNYYLKDANSQIPTSSLTLSIDANIPGATYTLNEAPVNDKQASLMYYRWKDYTLKANKVKGYRFDHWTHLQDIPVVPFKDEWKYYYHTTMPLKDGVPSNDWKKTDYDDSSWTVSTGAFGHKQYGYETELPYSLLYTSGSDVGKDSVIFKTAYFRKTFTVNDLSSKQGLKIHVNLVGAAVVYLNGVEVGRVNLRTFYYLPNGPITYDTYSQESFNSVATIDIPNSALREGENILAVEVHKVENRERNMRFDLQLTYQEEQASYEPEFASTMWSDKSIVAHYVPFDEPEPEIERVIVFNEIVSDNDKKDDYIELYNKGTEPVNIGGWYISDTPANNLLHQIPANNPSATTIQPGGRLILWADGNTDSQRTLHVGFKLGKEGETLVLSRKLEDNTVVIIDSVSFPSMGLRSYSRVPDGSDNWVIQALTFNAPNAPLSLNPDMETSLIALYPTQFTESFTVENAEGMMLSVLDLTGKVLIREQCTSNHMVIGTAHLKRGMYLVKVGDKTFKVIHR